MTLKELKLKQSILNYHSQQLNKMIEENIIYAEAYNKTSSEVDWENDRENYHKKWNEFYNRNLPHHAKEKIKRHRLFIQELMLEIEENTNQIWEN